MSGFHKDLTTQDNHTPHWREYANEADRINDVPSNADATALVTEDIGKWAYQIDLQTYWRLDSTGPTWTAVGGGAGAALSVYFRGLLNSTINVNPVTPAAVPWDGASIKSAAGITHDAAGANPERVQIDDDGTYAISANVVYVSNAGVVRAVTQLTIGVNGIVDTNAGIGSSGYGRASIIHNTMSLLNTVLELTAGDYIEIFVQGNASTGTVNSVPDASVLTVVKINAVTGGGGGGGGSPVAAQDEGTEILAEPTAFNFVGTGVEVTDAGGGVAQVDVAGLPGGTGDVVGPAASLDNEVPRYDGVTGKLLQAGTNVFIDDTGRMGIGAAPTQELFLSGDARQTLEFEQFSDSAGQGGRFQSVRGRGTRLSKTSVQDGDNLFQISARGQVGASDEFSARLTIDVAGPVSSGVVPSSWLFETDNLAGAITPHFRIGPDDNEFFTPLKLPISAGVDVFAGPAAQNVVHIYQEADFPISGSDIVLVAGTVYVLMAPISTDKQILHPDTGGAFSPAKIVSSNKELNTLTSTGTGGAFLRRQSGQGQLVLQNLIITNTGSRVFADVSGLTQTALLTELDDTSLFSFDDGTVFDTCIFNANNATFWNGLGDITMIDAEANWTDMFTANFSDSAMPTVDVRSGSGSVQPSFFNIRNSKLSSHPNEAFFMLHSNLIVGSTIRINGVEASPFTPGTGSFFDAQTVSITALADSGGAPGVRTVVSAAGHNVADGDTVVHTGFTTETQLNGTFVASDIVAGVSYEVVAVFSGTDTGVSSNTGLDQTDPKIIARDNPGQADSRAIGSCHANSNATVTVIATLNTYTDLNLGGNALAGANIERWSLTNTTTGEVTYNGIEPFSGTVFAQLSTLGETGSPEFRFRAVKNGVVLADGIETVREAGAVQIVTTGLVAPVSVVTGDTVRLQVNNIDDATDITIAHLSVSIQ